MGNSSITAFSLYLSIIIGGTVYRLKTDLVTYVSMFTWLKHLESYVFGSLEYLQASKLYKIGQNNWLCPFFYYLLTVNGIFFTVYWPHSTAIPDLPRHVYTFARVSHASDRDAKVEKLLGVWNF